MDYRIEPARPEDLSAILDVMAEWNMHHVPSPEMEELDLSRFYVARVVGSDRIVGAAGYQLLSSGRGKTTLLGVYPECAGAGVGKELQLARLEAMRRAGVRFVTTNADRPETIVWYRKHFGYREVGTLPKLCPFGLVDVDTWTTLELDLEEFFSGHDAAQAARARHVQESDPPPLSAYQPLIINVCLTGMVPTKRNAPHVPVSVPEIVRDAIAVSDAGAHVVHIHARDANGEATCDARVYEQIVSAVRAERPSLLCCVSTSGRGGADFAARSEVLHLDGDAKPDLASLTLGSMNFLSGPSVNAITTVERLALLMRDKGIKPELEVFDHGMVNLALYMERHGLLGAPKYFNIILGNLNTARATIGELAALTQALPRPAVWSAGALGQFQLPMNAAAIAAGGHVRVGLEDNVFYDYDRKIPATNVDLVKRIVRIADELGRPVASPDEARQMLGITRRAT